MGSNYNKFHCDRLNLAIHLLFVPVSAAAFALSVLSLVQGQLAASGWYFAVALLGFAIQAVGHKRENLAPEPFTSPANFVGRILAEQYFKFWRFLVSGDFWRAWNQRTQSAA